jgi:putative transposase
VRHRKVRQARLDHAHQTAALIVADHQFIAVEDLSVDGLARAGAKGARGRGLRKSVHDAALGQFLAVLTEKARRQGRVLIAVDRWFASTRICYDCKAKTGPRGQDELHVREWTCSACGVTHDRDINAARNILAEGLPTPRRGCRPRRRRAFGDAKRLWREGKTRTRPGTSR